MNTPADHVVYLPCACTYPDHLIRVSLDTCEPELRVDVSLNPEASLLRRLWLALKYVFKPHKPYSHWDETLVADDKVDDLYKLVSAYKFLRKAKKLSKTHGG